jgi:hypothetical protein
MGGRERNIEAYRQARSEIAEHRGEYVTVRNGRIVGFSRSFDEAFRMAQGDPDALVLEAGAEPIGEPARLGAHTWREA